MFTVRDLHAFCLRTNVPLVYDVHHHRCNPDGYDIGTATLLAIETWEGREPWMHISSAREGRQAPNPRPHADFIDPIDFPSEWMNHTFTVDVEAKAKDDAVLELRARLAR
jgi:UV DNA damage endonuclease